MRLALVAVVASFASTVACSDDAPPAVPDAADATADHGVDDGDPTGRPCAGGGHSWLCGSGFACAVTMDDGGMAPLGQPAGTCRPSPDDECPSLHHPVGPCEGPSEGFSCTGPLSVHISCECQAIDAGFLWSCLL
jgi:hypothetical protein